MELDALHERTVGEWARVVRGLDASQWGLATPCTEWSVRDLVNHVVGEDLWTVPLVNGATIAEVGERFDGDVLGGEPVARALEAADEAVTAVAARLPEGGTVHLSYGEERADEYVWQLCADHLIHGWDLAAATGADSRMPHDLVAALADWFSSHEEGYRSAGVIGEQGELTGDGQHDLLARFGRDEGWAPPGS